MIDHDIAKALEKLIDNITYSNNVLFEARENHHYIFSLPVYLNMRVVGLTQIDLENTIAEVEVVLTIRIKITELPRALVKSFKKNLTLEISNSKILKLDPSKNCDIFIEEIEAGQQKYVIYTIREAMYPLVLTKVFWTPFEKYYLLMSLKLRKHIIEHNNGQGKTIVLFNFMDCQKLPKYKSRTNNMAIIQFGSENVTGTFEISTSRVYIEFSQDRVPLSLVKVMKINKEMKTLKKEMRAKKNKLLNKRQHTKEETYKEMMEESQQLINKQRNKQQKYRIVPYNYAHLGITLFRHPSVAMATAVLPLLLLGILNLSIYFVQINSNKRLGLAAVLMVAFLALIPTIRNLIPPTQKFTFLQILVFTQLLGSLLTVVQTMDYKDLSAPIQYDGFFISNVIIVGMVFFAMVIQLIIFYFFAKPKLTQYPDRKTLENNVKYDKWNNVPCSFYLYMESRQMKTEDAEKEMDYLSTNDIWTKKKKP